MISEIIQPEKRDVSYEFDLPVMVVHNYDPKIVVVLTEFRQYSVGDFAYHGYYLGIPDNLVFKPYIIFDKDIKKWSKFKGKVVLSNFTENE